MSDILKIAVLAVGGQGGGVLSGWIRDLAEQNGFDAQVTSVAGVAQRTGATIYYIEMAPKGPKAPVFALSPTPGDIDILIAAEIMEAGRAAQRGFLSPDRTALIASTHRILAVSEKEIPGDGRGDGALVLETLSGYAKQIVAFDMEQVAKEAGSLISASLFGGLARAQVLPFETDAFRAVLEASRKGAAASLRAFEAALVHTDTPQGTAQKSPRGADGPQDLLVAWQKLQAEARALSESSMLQSGLRKVVDYQDVAYGQDYLERLRPFMGHDPALDEVAAKYIANAMCYDDILRVADLKTRATRTARLRQDQEIGADGIVQITEYFHPRTEEVIATLPRRLGAWIDQSQVARRVLGRLFRKGRRLRTDRMGGFVLLWLVAGLRPYRRALTRHATEMAHLDRLTQAALRHLPDRPALAMEILNCQRLIKGYSDTHARGLSRFDQVMAGAEQVLTRDDAADWVRRLRTAALADTDGMALTGALVTVASFTGGPVATAKAASTAPPALA